MQARTIFNSAILLCIIASSYAMTPECAGKLKDLQGTFIDLHYSTHDQDILGVSLSLTLQSENFYQLKQNLF